MYHRGY